MTHLVQRLRRLTHKVFAQSLDGLLSRVCALCAAGLADESAHLGLCAYCSRQLPKPHTSCPRCGEPHRAAQGQCTRCRSDPPSFVATLVQVKYEPPVDRLVHALKFRRERWLARPMGLLMAEQLEQARACGHAAQDLRFEPEMLVPIPLTAERLAQRGFNQAQAIAEAIAYSTGVPLNTGLLRRTRHTAPQTGLDLDARQENIAGVFKCHAAAPARVALIDDVMTTGATLRAAALALQEAGARSIINLVFARTAADHVSRRSGPS